jgi:hypothetical protein
MTPLMTYLAGFGLAAGVGAKAFIPLLLLGGLHYTRYFELSESFAWIADPAVMVVLGVLVVLEILVDAHPDLGGYADTVAYLPKFVAGCIGFASVVGTVDENLVALVSSGVLGGGTAVGVHWLRNRIRRPYREAAETVHEGFGKLASVSEAGAAATVAGASVLLPPAGLLLAGGLAAGGLVVARSMDSRRTPCSSCGEPIRPGALVCFHCGADQKQITVAKATPQSN